MNTSPDTFDVMKNRYRNPWHRMLNRTVPDFYENNAPMIAEYRGVKVYKLFKHGFDYVLDGCCITQRAGAKEYKQVIDALLDGEDCCAETVAEHLKVRGFNPLTYEQYSLDYAKGLRE